jgi:hypothetical protein
MRIITRGTMAVIGAALVIGAGRPTAIAVRVPAAGSRGWRVVQYFGQCSSAGVQSVTATGPLGAWATGQAWRFQCDRPGLLIARWDGRTWQDLRPPAAFGVAAGQESVGHAVAALSGSYSRTFVNRASFPHMAIESFALLWRSGRWRTFRLADGATFFSAVTFSWTNAWAFGGIAHDIVSPQDQDPYAVRFNGKRWRSVAIPVLPLGTAAPSARNIWAVGPVPSTTQPGQTYDLAHWNGKRWSTVALPFLQDVSGAFSGASVVSDGSHGAWVAADLDSFNQDEGVLVHVGGALLHWTGRIWTEVQLPFKTVGLGPLSRDGRGGLWVASLRAPLCTACDDLEMAHYRAGRWAITRLRVPGATVTAMRLIPATTNVWASASGALASDGQSDTTGVIFKYGP